MWAHRGGDGGGDPGGGRWCLPWTILALLRLEKEKIDATKLIVAASLTRSNLGCY